MRLLTAIVISIYSALMLGGQAFAQPQVQVLTAITAKQVATILESAGYRASVLTDTDGSKSVKSSMNGQTIWVSLAGCTEDNCPVLRFYTGWQKSPNDGLTINNANAWNGRWRYAKAYVVDNSNFYFALDVDMDGGITSDNIKAHAALFDYLLGEFFKFLQSAPK